MRSRLVTAGASAALAAIPIVAFALVAYGAPQGVPNYTSEVQGANFEIRYVSVPTSSACLVDHDGPCWGGWIYKEGAVKRLCIQNTGANVVWCTTAGTAAADQGIRLPATMAAPFCFEKANDELNLNCIAVSSASVVALSFEMNRPLDPTPTPSPTPTPTPTP